MGITNESVLIKMCQLNGYNLAKHKTKDNWYCISDYDDKYYTIYIEKNGNIITQDKDIQVILNKKFQEAGEECWKEYMG